MAPSAAASFSLDDVSARIAQLRAQLRADADVGGGSCVGGGDTNNAPSSSRFAALVELGSLLATCSLPEYSAPPAPFSGAYVPRSQDEEAALCLLLASDDEAFSSSSSSAAPAWPLALSLADDPARLASALARRPPPPAAAARLWCVRGEALLAAGRPEAARAAFRAATAAAEATKAKAVGSVTRTSASSSSSSSSEALLPMLLSVRAALAARDPAGALATARSAAALVLTMTTATTVTNATTADSCSSSSFPAPPPHAPTALALSSALWAAAHSPGGSAVLPCEARGGALAEALANAEAAAAADPACPRAAYQLALCLAERRGDLEAAAEGAARAVELSGGRLGRAWALLSCVLSAQRRPRAAASAAAEGLKRCCRRSPSTSSSSSAAAAVASSLPSSTSASQPPPLGPAASAELADDRALLTRLRGRALSAAGDAAGALAVHASALSDAKRALEEKDISSTTSLPPLRWGMTAVAEAWVELSRAYLSCYGSRGAPGAAECAAEALAAAPAAAPALTAAGEAAEAAGDAEGAAARYEAALGACPSYARAAAALGRVLLLSSSASSESSATAENETHRSHPRLGPHARALARSAVEDALRADPGRGEAWRALAALASADGDAVKSAAAARTAMALALSAPVMSFSRLPPAL